MRNIFTLILVIILSSASIAVAGQEHDHAHDQNTNLQQGVDGLQNESIENIKRKLPKINGVSNVGTDFWLSIPPCYIEVPGPQNFVKFFITSPHETQVNFEIPGKGTFMTKKTIANDVIVFDVTPFQAQAYVYSYTGGKPNPMRDYPGAGIHITSEKPIVVYVVIRYQYTSDGFLAIPTNGLGNQYIAAPYSSRPISASGHSNLPNMLTIVATEDNTIVDFTLGGNSITYIEADGVGEMYPGDEKRYRLDQGDVIIASTLVGGSTLSGSSIFGSKPIAVLSGHYCADIPVDNHWCDYNVEMDLPARTWGKHYHVPRVKNRVNNGVLRLFAKKDNTVIYKNGRAIAVIPKGGGGTLGNGWLEMRTWPVGYDPQIALFSGSEPITITYYNPGIQEDQQAGADWESDPFAMILTPIEQYQNEITFCTPAVRGGLGFSENYLMMVFESDQYGLPPEDLEFGTVNGNVTNWEKVGVKFSATPDLYHTLGDENDELTEPTPFDGVYFGHLNIDLDADGVYRMRGSKPFAVYSYGYDSYDSYGYPTSAALKDLETEDPDAPIPTGEPDCDGLVDINFTDLPEDEERRSNMYDVFIDEDLSYNYEVTKKELVSGERTAAMRLEVIDKTQDARAVLEIFDRAGNDTLAVYEYIVPKYTIYEKRDDEEINQNVYYGQYQLNESDERTFILENLSDVSDLVIIDGYVLNQDQNFTFTPEEIAKLTATPLAPLEKREFNVRFDAVEEGDYIDSIGVQDDCGHKILVEISAKVSSPLITADDWINNNPYTIASTGNQAETKKIRIFNDQCINGEGNVIESASDLIITGYTGPALPVYTHDLPNIDPNDPTTFITIPPGGSYEYTVSFLPTDPGNYPDQIVFESNATQCDPVSYIENDAIKSDFASNGYDWGVQRVVKAGTNYDAAYPAQADAIGTPITVVNNSPEADGADVLITGIVLNGQNPEFLIQDRAGNITDFSKTGDINAIFSNVRLTKNGGSETFPVFFEPKTTGDFEITFSFTTDAGVGEAQQYSLRGTGVVPNLFVHGTDNANNDASDVDYGKVEANNPAAAVTKSITIGNYPDDATFGAELEVFNVTYPNGTDGWDVSAIPTTLTLNINEAQDFDVVFAPDQNQTYELVIQLESDGDQDNHNGPFNNTLRLLGEGVVPNVIPTAADFNTCVGNPQTQEFSYINNGTQAAEILSVEITDANNQTPNDVSIVDVNSLIGSTVDPNQTVPFDVVYNPTFERNNDQMTITVTTTRNDSQSDNFNVNSVTLKKDLIASQVLVRDNGGEGRYEIGDRFRFDISLGNGPSADADFINNAQLEQMILEVRYTSSLIKYDTDNSDATPAFELGADYMGDFAIDVQYSEDQRNHESVATITVTSTNPGSYIGTSGMLASLYFDILVPSIDVDLNDYNKVITDDQLQPVISVVNLTPGNECGSFNDSNPVNISLDPTCVLDLRALTFGDNNEAGSVAPNPADQNSTLTFSIAFDSQTEINVFNTSGKLVATVFSGELSKGEHTLNLPMDQLGNGTYVYEIRTVNWSARDKFVVSK